MISIAIDGPSGSGKSTISKVLAKKLNFLNVDTGALYRAIALYIVQNNLSFNDEKTLSNFMSDIKIGVKNNNSVQRTFLNDVDVTEDLRAENVTKISSDIATYSCVRDYLMGIQRKLASENNVVMDGRDIGTVVLPDADVKIFLDASPKVRAMRRYNQLKKQDKKIMYDDILEAINKRDFNDKNRKRMGRKIRRGPQLHG